MSIQEQAPDGACYSSPMEDVLFLFTMYIPAQTRRSDMIPLSPNAPLSPRTIAEMMTPQIGFIKPNTATFETGLYFSSTDHNE